jgi:hypothetical protein
MKCMRYEKKYLKKNEGTEVPVHCSGTQPDKRPTSDRTQITEHVNSDIEFCIYIVYVILSERAAFFVAD